MRILRPAGFLLTLRRRHMDDDAKIYEAKRYLRDKYASDVPGLRALREDVANAAFEAVTITGQSYEGMNTQGSMTFEPMALFKAIQDVIAELDPTNTPDDPPTVTHADFSQVRLLT